MGLCEGQQRRSVWVRCRVWMCEAISSQPKLTMGGLCNETGLRDLGSTVVIVPAFQRRWVLSVDSRIDPAHERERTMSDAVSFSGVADGVSTAFVSAHRGFVPPRPEVLQSHPVAPDFWCFCGHLKLAFRTYCLFAVIVPTINIARK